MTETQRAAMQQALEALEFFRGTAICDADTKVADEGITALRAALAEPEPEQEPVRLECREHGQAEWVDCSREAFGINPRRYVYRALYTATPARQPLTPAQEHADELLDALKALLHDPTGCAFCDSGTLRIRVVTGKLCQHDEQCGFVKARAAIKMVEEARPCA